MTGPQRRLSKDETLLGRGSEGQCPPRLTHQPQKGPSHTPTCMASPHWAAWGHSRKSSATSQLHKGPRHQLRAMVRARRRHILVPAGKCPCLLQPWMLGQEAATPHQGQTRAQGARGCHPRVATACSHPSRTHLRTPWQSPRPPTWRSRNPACIQVPRSQYPFHFWWQHNSYSQSY